MAEPAISIALRITVCVSQISTSRRSLPRVMRVRSSRSSINRACNFTLRLMSWTSSTTRATQKLLVFVLPRRNVVRRIKAGKVFADDFLRCVAFDFLSACVPRHHNTVRIEHVDGVLFHAIHQNVELLGCLRQYDSGSVVSHWLQTRFRMGFGRPVLFGSLHYPQFIGSASSV